MLFNCWFLATKTDLRDDPSLACYTPEEGKRLKKKTRAQSYMECSALKGEGLEEIFEEAVRVYVRSKNRRNGTRQCIIL